MNFHHQRKHSVWTAVLFSLLVAAPVPYCHAQSKDAAPSTERPLFEMDLRNYGYKSHVRGKRDYWSIAFAENDDLVLGWTTFDDPDAGKRTGYLTAAPSHLHALVLNARTGQKKIAREWAASTFYANIHPVAKGEFLICTGDAIRLLSHNFDVVHELALSRFGPCTANEISPSGRSFSIDTGVGKNFQRGVMSTELFAPVATWSNEARGVHFNDAYLAGNCTPNSELCVRKFDASWVPLVFNTADRHSRVRSFLNESALVLTTRSGLVVVTTEGNLLFHVDLQSKQSIGETTVSSSGQRLAVVQMRMRGVTNEVLDMYAFASDDQVIVYDLLEGKAIYARKVKGTSPWPPFTEHRNRLAISSDGALLAIFDDGMLSVYQLPAPNLKIARKSASSEPYVPNQGDAVRARQ